MVQKQLKGVFGTNQHLVNHAAKEQFRDTADKDYIVARYCYRVQFYENFFWSAGQAIEKYIKGILIFNDIKPGNSHNLVNLFSKLLGIQDINFDFPDSLNSYIDYLNKNYNNRYRQKPTLLKGYVLPDIDRAVWHLRRYCQDLRYQKEDNSKTRKLNLHEIGAIQNPALRHRPADFKILNGHLEKIIMGDNNKREREDLIWQNGYFGQSQKTVVLATHYSFSFSQPIHCSFPPLKSELRKYIYYSKDNTESNPKKESN